MQDYNNPKSSKIKKLIKTYFLSAPQRATANSKEKVLDLGCGWGFYFGLNPLATGIDADKDCIKYLKSLGYKAIESDITNILPIKNNSFEWVICHDVLEHFTLQDAKKITDNAFLALKNNGKFLIVSPNKNGYESGIKRGVGHKHFITKNDILIITAGKFSLKKHYFYPFPDKLGEYFVHNKEVMVLEKISN